MSTKPITKKRILQIVKKLESIDYAKVSIGELEKIIDPLLKGYHTSVPVYSPDTYIFRGRICEKPVYLKNLSYPPKELITKYGRANDISKPMFYGTIGKTIPLFELNPADGDTIAISVWKTAAKMPLIHIGFTYEVARQLKSTRDFFTYKFADDMRKTTKENIAAYNYLAKVFIQKVPKNKNHLYKLSVAIANRLCMPPVQGLIYPTVAMFGDADNIVLLPSYVDKHLQFVSVEYIKIHRISDEGSYDTLDSAVDVTPDGKLAWTGKLLTWNVSTEIGVSFSSGGDHWVVKNDKGKRIDPKPTGEIHRGNTLIEKEYLKQINGTMGLTRPYNVTGGDKPLTISATLHLDMKKNEKFVSFYIPVCTDPIDITSGLLRNLEMIFEEGKIVHQKDIRTNEVIVKYEDFTFNDHLYVFSEVPFDFGKLPMPFGKPVTIHFTSVRPEHVVPLIR